MFASVLSCLLFVCMYVLCDVSCVVRVLVYQRSTSQSNEVQRRQNAGGQRTRTRYSAIQQRIAVHRSKDHYIAIHRNTAQHTAVQCNRKQYRAVQQRRARTNWCNNTVRQHNATTQRSTAVQQQLLKQCSARME